ncbi:MAG: aryl-sulfate sulfotransferase [Candidatus Omnitrophica bacterium]|nr:aryl-sulfate sulfotransferase [Candidatus Omnitrophota bacterium]
MPSRVPLSLLFLLLFTISFQDISWGATPSDEDPSESLLSLPYIQYVETEKAPDKQGTTIYNKNKAFSGYNIYTSNNNLDVFVKLIDMDGALVHAWDRNPQDKSSRWQHVLPFPNGSIFLTSQWTQLDWQLLDANSRNLAVYDIPGQKAHHAAYWLNETGFLSLLQNTIRIPFQDLSLKIEDNSLVHVSSQGVALKTVSLGKLLAADPNYQEKCKKIYDKLKKSPPTPSKRKPKEPSFEILHANNIENLEWDIPGIAKKGSWLITIRNLSKIILVDPNKEEILWQWGENTISRPHHATFLKGDKILLFDNGVQQKSSRVIVIDIKSKEILWQYGQKPGQEFFTATGGSAQRLPNGNTLITQSEEGRAFEVTDSGAIVWEWYADFYLSGKHKGKRRTIYRMQRLPYNFFTNVTFNHGKTKP